MSVRLANNCQPGKKIQMRISTDLIASDRALITLLKAMHDVIRERRRGCTRNETKEMQVLQDFHVISVCV